MNQPNEENLATPMPKSFISSVPLWLLMISNIVSILISVGLSFILFNQTLPNSQISKNQQIFAIQEYNKKAKEENETYVNKQMADFSMQLNKKLNTQKDINKHNDYYIRNYLTRIRQLEEKTIPPINLNKTNQPYEIGYGFIVIPKAIDKITNENNFNGKVKVKVINTSNINYDNLLLNLKVGKQEVLLSSQSSGSNEFNLLPGQETILEGSIQDASTKDLDITQITFKVSPSPVSR